MNRLPAHTEPATPGIVEPNISVPCLIGQVYDSVPPSLRARMLEHLMRPLGILSLMTIANGVFASIRMRNPASDPTVGLEDAAIIQTGDVVKLADWVQQVSVEAIDGLAQLLLASPALTRSAAAAALLSLLLQISKQGRDRMSTHD
ncbi:MAG: hypothetical protein RL300_1131 [Pseudomonadota bacterium]